MNITLSQKERSLLEDAKSHEEACIKKYDTYEGMANDPQLKQIFTVHSQSERTHLNSINTLLSGTIPQMNGQNQNSNQNMNFNNTSNTQNIQSNFSDKDLCSDILMTEKYVSGTYDTAIFEFRDTNVRDVLNHIQKEEQKHGEAIFKYMESKNLYTVQ